jgi:tetratricopeptide (TPR) repeat protein
MEGVEKYLSPEFAPERSDAQAQVYFRNIFEGLSSALRKGTFVSPKDSFRAQGYLAYYQDRWDDAVAWWAKALKEEPSDARLQGDLSSLQNLIIRTKEKKELDALARRADVYSHTGYPREALEAWQSILNRRPDYPGAREKVMVAKIALEKSVQQAELRRRTEQGVAEFKAGRPLAAAQIWLEVLQKDPSFDQARSWLKLVGPALEESPSSLPSPVKATPAAAAAGSPKRDPDQAAELYKQGLLLYSDDKLTDAIASWKEALTFDPSLDKARQALQHAERELAFH